MNQSTQSGFAQVHKGVQEVEVSDITLADGTETDRSVSPSVAGELPVASVEVQDRLDKILNALERIVLHLSVLTQEEFSPTDIEE